MNLQYLYDVMANTVEVDGIGHWRVLPDYAKENPEDYFGFVYCIENTQTGKLYIGRKQTKHLGKKTSKTYGKPTNWKTYTGSSKHLSKDIENFGKDKFKFHILEYYKQRGGLNAAEIEWQVKCDVLTARFPNSDERIFLNGQIAALRWLPKEFYTQEERQKMSERMRKTWRDPEKRQAMMENRKYDFYTEDLREARSKVAKETGLGGRVVYGENHYKYKGAYEGICVETGVIIVVPNNDKLRELGFNPSLVRSVVCGNRKTHKGYTWRRIDGEDNKS